MRPWPLFAAFGLASIASAGHPADEPVPVRWDNYDPFGGIYRGVTMDMHWVDDANKKQMILDALAQVDYVVIPSQRRLWASTRLPATYPMTIAYYRALFDGSLGFDLVASFQAPLVIGPLQVSAEAATWACHDIDTSDKANAHSALSKYLVCFFEQNTTPST